MKNLVPILLVVLMLLTVTSCKKQSTGDINTVHVTETTAATDANGSTAQNNENNNSSGSDTDKADTNSDLTKADGKEVVGVVDLVINGDNISTYEEKFSKNNAKAMVFEGEDFTTYTIYGDGVVAQKKENKGGNSEYQFSLYGSNITGPLGIKIGDSSKTVLSKLSNEIDDSLSFDTPENSELIYLKSITRDGVKYTCAATADKNNITATIKSSDSDITVKFKFSNDVVDNIEILM